MLTAFVVIMLACATTTNAGVRGKPVEYVANGTTLKGYLASTDSVTEKRPGILVVHEWWGHNDYTRKRAEMLAELGYVALAVDMYGDGKTVDHPSDAGKMSGEVSKNMPVMQSRFNAAMEYLKQQPGVDSLRIGAIGYCFGGGVVLNMARGGADLKGVVSFHGSLGTRTPVVSGLIKAEILVCNGADDKFVSADDIENLKKEMKNAGVDFRFINYPGAIHAFTNPAATAIGRKFGIALAYNEPADRKSWAAMTEFFARVFKK